MNFGWFVKHLGLLGQVNPAAETSLLACLDESSKTLGFVFNGAVIRKALKLLAYDDLRMCNFTRLVNDTRETLLERFVADAENADETPQQFFLLICSQIMQRLIKSVTQQKKDRVFKFSTSNQSKHLNCLTESFETVNFLTNC